MMPGPSRGCFLIKEDVRNHRLLVDLRCPFTLFQSAHRTLQTDPSLGLVLLLTQRLLNFHCHATHLLARCDQPDDPSARITRR